MKFDFDLLAKIDHEMMLMDIDLMEWQGHLDMAKMAAEGLLLELWTDDDPPRKITTETIKQSTGQSVNIMQRWNGKWNKVGTGVLNPDGMFSADITSDETLDMLTRGVISGVSLRNDPPPIPSPYETLVATPGSGVVEIPRVAIPKLPTHIEGSIDLNLPSTKRSIKGLFPDLENHPFFKETSND